MIVYIILMFNGTVEERESYPKEKKEEGDNKGINATYYCITELNEALKDANYNTLESMVGKADIVFKENVCMYGNSFRFSNDEEFENVLNIVALVSWKNPKDVQVFVRDQEMTRFQPYVMNVDISLKPGILIGGT